ncbi:MAG: MFS transporter [Synergistaceae bacterium]|jgi:GPH family glycoside/pentoside/hexuronide:cation symporter|nr:MFS transporter [Synergistaceae bacterium]
MKISENFTLRGVRAVMTLGYSSINFGSTLLTMTVASFLMYYYTDVLALPTATVSLILLAARFFDGAIDPFIGYYMDRRETKYGKYRGYVFYWTLPACILLVCLFSPSPLPGYAGMAWCLMIYLAWSFCFSMIEVANLPMLALIGKPEERVGTNTLKIAASIIAVMVSHLTFKFVGLFGGGSERTGFSVTMVVFAVTALLSCLIGARCVNEKSAAAADSLSLRETIAHVLGNRRLVFLYVTLICDQLGMSVRIQSAVYYLKYYVNRPDIIPAYFILGLACSFLTQPLILWASKRFSMSRLMVGGYLGSVLGTLLMWYAGMSIWMILAANVFYGLVTAFPNNLMFVYIASLSDDMAKKKNSSYGAVVNSLMMVSSKLGYAVAGSVIALVLYMTSYEPNVTQSAESLMGIKICFIAIIILTKLMSAFFAFLSFM